VSRYGSVLNPRRTRGEPVWPEGGLAAGSPRVQDGPVTGHTRVEPGTGFRELRGPEAPETPFRVLPGSVPVALRNIGSRIHSLTTPSHCCHRNSCPAATPVRSITVNESLAPARTIILAARRFQPCPGEEAHEQARQRFNEQQRQPNAIT